jgi:anaerobic magnesium-protoporphyrin IX monomethyl ester cyclase
MHVVFVHTPMATLELAPRENFWREFDARYHAAHPGLRHMENVLWELPHWMHWLAGVLVDQGIASITALNPYASTCTLKGIDRARTEAALGANPADLYLFSPMTVNLPFALEIASIAKDIYPKCQTAFGGVVATPLWDQIAADAAVDFVISGRGEYALPALISALRGQIALEDVGNLAIACADGAVRKSTFEYPWMPVESIPSPKIDLFDRSIGNDIRYLRQVYALGCPYKCSFCTIQTIGQKADYVAPNKVIEQIHSYRVHYGEHHNVYFGDETFTVNKARTIAMCEALAADGSIHYDIQTRLNLLCDDEILISLKNSGCCWIEVGIESLNQTTQDIHKQRLSLRTIRDTLARVRDAGLPTCAFMVNGFPNQTIDDMKRSIDNTCSLIEEDLLQESYLFGLVPYPGSRLYKNPDQFGLKILHHDFRYYHEDMLPVYETAFATPDEIFEVFYEGVAQLGAAMGASSASLGLSQTTDRSKYGQFWTGSHV